MQQIQQQQTGQASQIMIQQQPSSNQQATQIIQSQQSQMVQQATMQLQQQQVKFIQQKVGNQTITIQQTPTPIIQQPIQQQQQTSIIQKNIVIQQPQVQDPAPVLQQNLVKPQVQATNQLQTALQQPQQQQQLQQRPAEVQPPPPVTIAPTTSSAQVPATQSNATQSIQMIPAMDPNKVCEEEVDVNWLWVCSWRGCPRYKLLTFQIYWIRNIFARFFFSEKSSNRQTKFICTLALYIVLATLIRLLTFTVNGAMGLVCAITYREKGFPS
jgi:AT-rich interactive domain-containing protein 2